MTNPLYKHDCNMCKFLGSDEGKDLYICIPKDVPEFATLIARNSAEGRDYFSGLAFSKPYVSIDGIQRDGIPALVKARELALSAGYEDAISLAT